MIQHLWLPKTATVPAGLLDMRRLVTHDRRAADGVVIQKRCPPEACPFRAVHLHIIIHRSARSHVNEIPLTSTIYMEITKTNCRTWNKPVTVIRSPWLWYCLSIISDSEISCVPELRNNTECQQAAEQLKNTSYIQQTEIDSERRSLE